MATAEKSGTSSSDESIKRLAKAINGIKIAMFTTSDGDGSLRSRPMATLDREFDGQLWFFTREHSAKVESVQAEQHVNLSYADRENERYISVAGRATLVKDRELMKSVWSPIMKAFFPDGLEDPELALLRIDVDGAEIWDSPPGFFVKLVGFTEAIATGKPYDEIHGNDTAKLDFGSAGH